MFTLQVSPSTVIVENRKDRPEPRDSRRPVRTRLPWFRCRKCQTRLAPMDVVDGRTCVRIGPYAVSFKIEITCERCGTMREFISMAAL
jgi:hypothetical protein